MDAEVTEAAPSEDATQSIYAWSEASDEETQVFQRRSWKVPIAVAVLAIVAIATVGVVKMRPHHSAPENPAAQAAQPAAPIAPPKPVPTQQTSVPAQELDPDQRFVAILRNQGWVFSVPDGQVAQEGRGVCRDMANGTPFDGEVDAVTAGSGILRAHAIRFVTTAADILCPQYSKP